jgi:predicted Zn-dependent peptidase
VRALTVTLLLCSACAPLIAGTSRVLPPALQYDPASFAGPRMEREPSVPSKLVLANGVEVLWTATPADPLVDVSLLVGCGRTDDPVGSPELTWLALRSALSVGTPTLTATEQQVAFERLGVDLSVSVDDGDSALHLVVPRANLAAAMQLLNDSLSTPRFDATTFEQRREKLALGIEGRVTQPEFGLVSLMRQAVTSKTSGLGQSESPAAIRAMSLEAVRAQASRCLQPANLVVALTGDLDAAAVREALSSLSARPRGVRVVHPAPPPAPTTQKVWLSPELHGSRVDIILVGRTPALAPRDRIAGAMLATILVSLVHYDLRETVGHVYSVSADVETGPGFGIVYVKFSTRAEKALESVRRVLAELSRWWTNWPVSPQVVESARHALSNAAARGLVSTQTLKSAERQLRDGAGFDERPWARQLDEVRAHHLADLFVLAFPPGRLQVVVTGAVGSPRDWAQFGQVTAP